MHGLRPYALRLDLPLDEVRQTPTLTPAHAAHVLAAAPAEHPMTSTFGRLEPVCDQPPGLPFACSRTSLSTVSASPSYLNN